MDYLDFLQSKPGRVPQSPIAHGDIADKLFDFQKECALRLLRMGRCAAFLDTGLGKTIIQCEWARHIRGRVLFVAPLAVAQQTIREARDKLEMVIEYSKNGTGKGQFMITNYERLDNFETGEFAGVVLDESSILKGMNSKTKELLCAKFMDTPYRLACTATPAPNDYMELGNHAEFLGIMTRLEMLSKWFVHDSANTADWRIKGHAVKPFWQWVASWAVCISKPSDIGYDDSRYELPALNIQTHAIASPTIPSFEDGMLFDLPEVNATTLHRKKRETLHERVDAVARLVNASDEPWIVWCESNAESEHLAKAIPDAVEVRGSDSVDTKEARLVAFSEGRARVIVSKPKICGFGMNWQHCRNIAFASISYSYEQFYQAIRRSWRFGQTRTVNVHVMIADVELPVWRTIQQKTEDHQKMKEHMKYARPAECAASMGKIAYNPDRDVQLPAWLEVSA